jgi:holo-[acyl-carrier protein] synthase
MIVGTGVDIVEIRRIRSVLERQGERFVERVFSPGEQQYCRAHRDTAPYYAVRFAAKEALFKALGTGWGKGVTWRDVEVERSTDGVPSLVLRGEARRLAESRKITAAHLSLSHGDDSAVAVVILES